MAPRDPYHAFTELVLTIHEPLLAGVRTEHRFELRAATKGAEVWRASAVIACGDDGLDCDAVDSEPRLVGKLTTRQVVELLTEIERSGIYEALPAMGLVEGMAAPMDDADRPLVSMRVESTERRRDLIDHAPADERLVDDVVRIVRAAVDDAAERALTRAG
jgi:hypothetical protein